MEAKEEDIQYCIGCGLELKPLYDVDFEPHRSMWDGGTVDRIYCNYGSEFDGDMYLIAICDTCIVSRGLKKVGEWA